MNSPSAVGRGGCGNNFAGRLSQEGAAEYRLALLGSLPSHPDSSPLIHLTARWWPYNPPQRRSAAIAGVAYAPCWLFSSAYRGFTTHCERPSPFAFWFGLENPAERSILKVALQTTMGFPSLFGGSPHLSTTSLALQPIAGLSSV